MNLTMSVFVGDLTRKHSKKLLRFLYKKKLIVVISPSLHCQGQFAREVEYIRYQNYLGHNKDMQRVLRPSV